MLSCSFWRDSSHFLRVYRQNYYNESNFNKGTHCKPILELLTILFIFKHMSLPSDNFGRTQTAFLVQPKYNQLGGAIKCNQAGWDIITSMTVTSSYY